MNTRLQILLAYGFRPFFLLAAAYAIVSLLVWVSFFLGYGPLPVQGDIVSWHIYELLYGFGAAALAGFLLTAVPEFTGCDPLRGKPLAGMVLLWLLGRILMWTLDLLGIWPAALVNFAFLFWLGLVVAPPVLRDRERLHTVFVWLLGLMWTVEIFVFLAWDQRLANWPFLNFPARYYLNLTIAVYMLLIIAAVSRVSMIVVNQALEEQGGDDTLYFARPPRRNMTMIMITLFEVVHLFEPGSNVSGWLGLAAAAAVFNLLNDWHLGRVVTHGIVAPLYLTYWMMGIGYALLGAHLLFDFFPPNHARHFLTAGAMGLAIISVLFIAGTVHTGRKLRADRWLWFSVLLILSGTLIRTIVPVVLPLQTVSVGYGLSALAWCAAFAVFLYRFSPFLTSPRIDGQPG